MGILEWKLLLLLVYVAVMTVVSSMEFEAIALTYTTKPTVFPPYFAPFIYMSTWLKGKLFNSFIREGFLTLCGMALGIPGNA